MNAVEMIDPEVRYRAVVHYKYFVRSLRKVSKIYGVSKSSLQRWVGLSLFTPKSRRHRKRPKTDDLKQVVETLLSSNPFFTLEGLASVVRSVCPIKRSAKTIGRCLRRWGYTQKKAYRTVKHGPHHAEEVRRFCSSFLSSSEHPGGVVSIDETGVYLGDLCGKGYSKRGTRLNVVASRTLRRVKLTVVMAITSAGILHHKVLSHNCRKQDFIDFVNELPASTSASAVMDNIRFHHSKETIDAFRQRGITPLFIPAYSPEFNPIESVFGPIKRAYRSLCPCKPDEQDRFNYKNALEMVLERFKMNNMAPYFRHVIDESNRALALLNDGKDVSSLGYKV